MPAVDYSGSGQQSELSKAVQSFFDGLYTFTGTFQRPMTDERIDLFRGHTNVQSSFTLTEELYGQPSPKVLGWQQALVGAGLINPKASITFGMIDDQTWAQTVNVFQFMERNKIADPYKALQMMAEMSSGQKKGPTHPGFRAADPVAVRELVDKVFNDAAGRDPNDAEASKLINTFRTFERRAYSSAIASSEGRASTEYDPAARVQAVAEEDVAPTETTAYGVLEQFSNFLRLIGAE